MNRHKGFTLIELVMVIAIIGILMTVSGINYKIIDKIEAKNQIKELTYNINEIKRYSQIHRYKGSIDIENHGYTLNYPNKSEHIEFNKLINLEYTNLSKIRFTSRGKPSYMSNINSAGTIIYSVGKDKYKITIEPVTGKVNLRLMGEDENEI
jgi:prepilin-type N-terminal cleavage/methylation domain-containing protein